MGTGIITLFLHYGKLLAYDPFRQKLALGIFFFLTLLEILLILEFLFILLQLYPNASSENQSKFLEKTRLGLSWTGQGGGEFSRMKTRGRQENATRVGKLPVGKLPVRIILV